MKFHAEFLYAMYASFLRVHDFQKGPQHTSTHSRFIESCLSTRRVPKISFRRIFLLKTSASPSSWTLCPPASGPSVSSSPWWPLEFHLLITPLLFMSNFIANLFPSFTRRYRPVCTFEYKRKFIVSQSCWFHNSTKNSTQIFKQKDWHTTHQWLKRKRTVNDDMVSIFCILSMYHIGPLLCKWFSIQFIWIAFHSFSKVQFLELSMCNAITQLIVLLHFSTG